MYGDDSDYYYYGGEGTNDYYPYTNDPYYDAQHGGHRGRRELGPGASTSHFADDPYADTWGAGMSGRSARNRDHYAGRGDAYGEYYAAQGQEQGQASSQVAYSAYYDAPPVETRARSPYGEASYYEGGHYQARRFYQTGVRRSTPSPSFPPLRRPYLRPQPQPQPQPSVAPGPSTEYLLTASTPSHTCARESESGPGSESAPRKLLILDLNGTLLVRKERRSILPRPYMPAFRAYLFAPQTRAWLDTMVWSSAQPHNVEKMVRRCFFENGEEEMGKSWGGGGNGWKSEGTDKWEGKLVAVWGRDTLGLSHADYSRKSQTTKDLAKPWSALGDEGHSARTTLLLDDSPAKARLQPYNHVCIAEYGEEARERDVASKRGEIIRELARFVAEKAEERAGSLEGDLASSRTARRKEKKERKKRERWLKTGKHAEDALVDQQRREFKGVTENEAQVEVEAEVEVEVETEVETEVEVEVRSESENGDKDEIERALETSTNTDPEPKPELGPEHPKLDETLLAVVGILDALRYESNVAGWVRAGGLWCGAAPPSVDSLTATGGQTVRAPSPTDDEVGVDADDADDTGSGAGPASDEPPPPSSSPQERGTSPAPTFASATGTGGTVLSGTARAVAALTRDPKRQRSQGSPVAPDGEPGVGAKKRARRGPSVPAHGTDDTAGVDVVVAGNDAETLGVGTDTDTDTITNADAEADAFAPARVSGAVPVSELEAVTATTAAAAAAARAAVPVPGAETHVPMWFEDAVVFGRWVARGRAALRALGIEEQDGVGIQDVPVVPGRR
ncbi:hypothetical protein M0805_004828 [Coniferiporia weirii]|nr:hypothetical protein M0805_004828 [Coniferiporia weirii]